MRRIGECVCVCERERKGGNFYSKGNYNNYYDYY